MCMKYVNASARCFREIQFDGNNIVSYSMPFTNLKAEKVNNKYYIKNFYVSVIIDMIGTSNEENNSINPLSQKEIYDFIVRITHCSRDTNQQICYDLQKFSINLEDMYNSQLVNKACFDFYNCSKNIFIDSLELPCGPGKYVIKTLIKKHSDEEYVIQAMTPLFVQ